MAPSSISNARCLPPAINCCLIFLTAGSSATTGNGNPRMSLNGSDGPHASCSEIMRLQDDCGAVRKISRLDARLRNAITNGQQHGQRLIDVSKLGFDLVVRSKPLHQLFRRHRKPDLCHAGLAKRAEHGGIRWVGSRSLQPAGAIEAARRGLDLSARHLTSQVIAGDGGVLSRNRNRAEKRQSQPSAISPACHWPVI